MSIITMAAVLTCTLAPVGDTVIPEGTIPMLNIRLPDDTAAILLDSQDEDYIFPLDDHEFLGEEPQNEVVLVGRSSTTPDAYQLTRISRSSGSTQPVFVQTGRLYWLDFRFGDATWDPTLEEFDFELNYEGICSLSQTAGRPTGAGK